MGRYCKWCAHWFKARGATRADSLTLPTQRESRPSGMLDFLSRSMLVIQHEQSRKFYLLLPAVGPYRPFCKVLNPTGKKAFAISSTRKCEKQVVVVFSLFSHSTPQLHWLSFVGAMKLVDQNCW